MREAILNAVWLAFGVDADELTMPGRGRYAARARFAAAVVMADMGASNTEIACLIRRDRTTAKDAIASGRRIATECSDFAARVEYVAKLTKEAAKARNGASGGYAGQDAKLPPALKIEPSSGVTAEEAIMRSRVNAASVRLGQLLAREASA